MPAPHSPASDPTMPRFVAVASGKGGVGKTWFAITLAQALTLQGRRVLLFDGDFGLANVDIQIGLVPRHDIGDVLNGAVSMAQAVERFEPGGFDVLAGRSGSGTLAALGPEALDHILGLLGAFGLEYDHVILDIGAGIDGEVRRLTAWAETLLVLATDEPASITDSYATLKLHTADRPTGDARLIINQVASPAAAERTAVAIRRACTTFLGRAPSFLGSIRRDTRVPEAIRRQALLLTRHPACPAAQDVARIAEAL